LPIERRLVVVSKLGVTGQRVRARPRADGEAVHRSLLAALLEADVLAANDDDFVADLRLGRVQLGDERRVAVMEAVAAGAVPECDDGELVALLRPHEDLAAVFAAEVLADGELDPVAELVAVAKLLELAQPRSRLLEQVVGVGYRLAHHASSRGVSGSPTSSGRAPVPLTTSLPGRRSGRSQEPVDAERFSGQMARNSGGVLLAQNVLHLPARDPRFPCNLAD
jgi:hypothetical protein